VPTLVDGIYWLRLRSKLKIKFYWHSIKFNPAKYMRHMAFIVCRPCNVLTAILVADALFFILLPHFVVSEDA
jgi:hypothetical protein